MKRLIWGCTCFLSGVVVLGFDLVAVIIHRHNINRWLTYWGKLGTAFWQVGFIPAFVGIAFIIFGGRMVYSELKED